MTEIEVNATPMSSGMTFAETCVDMKSLQTDGCRLEVCRDARIHRDQIRAADLQVAR